MSLFKTNKLVGSTQTAVAVLVSSNKRDSSPKASPGYNLATSLIPCPRI